MLRSDLSPVRHDRRDPHSEEHEKREEHDQPPPQGPQDAPMAQLLAPDGTRRPDPDLDPWAADLDDERIAALYRDMVVVRRLDLEATALQRQGQLGLWPPLFGQEAAQIGSARALRKDDFVFSSYREHAVAWCRGVSTTDLLRVWRGTGHAGWDPYAVGMAAPAVIIGAQTLHATGYALGCVKDGVDSASIAYFGDGATSQGDVNEAMVFAATFRAPVVFFCQNNQWAISEPVSLVAVRPLADRAPGFGIPSMRIDGNDVLAVTAATRIALDRARRGEGPTFIEAVTYRRGPHTTSDDPTRYVDPGVQEAWVERDPLLRVERYLERRGRLTPELTAEVTAAADQLAAEMRRGCLGLQDPAPLSVFDHVFTRPTERLEDPRRLYAAYLESFTDEEASR